MSILFSKATEDDIPELVRLRIAYMEDDFGGVSDHERECMEKQLPDYFNRKLGDELIAFVAKDGEYLAFCEVKYRKTNKKGNLLKAAKGEKIGTLVN